MSAAATAPQQINVADLELPQLGEVKKQLEEACFLVSVILVATLRRPDYTGTLTPNQLIRTTETSAGQVPLVHRERKGGQARK